MRTVIELGMPTNKSGMLQKDISKAQDISEKYLDPIIASLKTAGLIKNVGGKKSGYILNRPVNQITVLDVFRAFEMGPCIVPCTFSEKLCVRTGSCAAMEYWIDLNGTIMKHLKSVTIEKLAKRQYHIERKKK